MSYNYQMGAEFYYYLEDWAYCCQRLRTKLLE